MERKQMRENLKKARQEAGKGEDYLAILSMRLS